MPFLSERQRKWMHANKPEMAKRWESEAGTKKPPVRKRAKAKRTRRYI